MGKLKNPHQLKKFNYFFREITIVVIGVLIAVSINNFKENIDNANYVEKTLAVIEEEVNLSQKELDTVLKKHYKMAKILNKDLIEEGEESLGEMITKLGGFQVATIKNVSLRFFISNKAELLDFDLISQLLEIESQSDILNSKVDRLANYVYEHINEKHKETKQTFAFMLYDVIESEESLLEFYSAFLNDNKSLLK